MAIAIALLAGCYLIGLSIASVTHPAQVRRFLNAHASSARAHFLELALRTLVGVGLVVAGPARFFPDVFRVAGWVLIGTSVVLAILPWRMHQRFAEWSVPMATRQLALVSIGAFVGGSTLLLAFLLPRGGS